MVQRRNIVDQEREKSRINNLAKYFFDISKLSFTALVLGGVTPLYLGNSFMKISAPLLLAGVAVTSIFALIAYSLQK
jgi:hypothetical protein